MKTLYLSLPMLLRWLNISKTFPYGREPITDAQMVRDFLARIDNDNTCLKPSMEITSTLTFHYAITYLPTTITTVFLLAGLKGHKSLISETRTSGNKSFNMYVSVVEFTDKIWKRDIFLMMTTRDFLTSYKRLLVLLSILLHLKHKHCQLKHNKWRYINKWQ